jgi:4-amino-4-deoxy-L-arabinose transferase-like glycosyltransferase
MPDALMVAFLLAASLTVLRYWERPSTRRLLVAGVVSSAATAEKPGVAFPYLVALFVALAVSHRRLGSTVVTGRLPLYLALTGLMSGAYYVWGTRFSDYIWAGASSDRFTPDLALHGRFWERWWEAVSYLLSFPQSQSLLTVLAIAVGVAGLLVADRRHARATLIGLLVGYLAFAVTFAYYISGNPYYSLPLIPILALAIGVFAGFALERSRGAVRVALVGVILFVVAAGTYKSAVILRMGDPEARIADYRRIGDLTGHTTRALVVDEQLTTPLNYWGWVLGEDWELFHESPPPWTHPERDDFLVVVGAFGAQALESHDGLRRFTRGLPVVAQTSGFTIFDLRARNRASREDA